MLALPDLLVYHDWANGRTFDAIAALPSADWHRDLGSSFPSIPNVRAWPIVRIDATPAGLRTALAEIEAERTALVAADDPHRVVRYRLLDGREGADALGVLVQHVVNHASYHRGQLATMLRQLGHVPPATDLVRFVHERAAEAAE